MPELFADALIPCRAPSGHNRHVSAIIASMRARIKSCDPGVNGGDNKVPCVASFRKSTRATAAAAWNMVISPDTLLHCRKLMYFASVAPSRQSVVHTKALLRSYTHCGEVSFYFPGSATRTLRLSPICCRQLLLCAWRAPGLT